MNAKRLFRGFVTTLMMTVLCAGTAFAEFSAETETAHNEIGIGQWPKDSYLKTGKEIRKILDDICGKDTVVGTGYDEYGEECTIEYKVESLKSIESAPSMSEAQKAKAREIQESGGAVYAWYEDSTDTLYIYTDSQNVYMNPDSSYMFSGTVDWADPDSWDEHTFSSLTDISGLANWKADYVTNASYMFEDCSELSDVSALKDWKFSSLSDFTRMFYDCYALSDVSCLQSWSISDAVARYSNVFEETGAYQSYYTMDICDDDCIELFPDWYVDKAEFYDGTELVWTARNIKEKLIYFDHFNTYIYKLYDGFWENQIPAGEYVHLADLKKDGYLFNGWSKEPNQTTGDMKLFEERVENTDPYPEYNYYYRCTVKDGDVYYAAWKDDALLKAGSDLNDIFSDLAGDSNNITAIRHSHSAPAVSVDTQEIQEMGNKVLAWFDSSDGAIYWYSNAETVYANSSMARAFAGFESLTDLSGLRDWDTGRETVSMSYMFRGCTSLTDLDDISGWNTSNVSYADYMFADCTALSDASCLSAWDMSNVGFHVSNFVFNNTALEKDYIADPKQSSQYPSWYLKTTQFMNETVKVAEVQYPFGPGLYEAAVPEAPTKDGYVLKEWNSEPDGEGWALTFDGEGLCDYAYETYYAIWKEKQEAVLKPGQELNVILKKLAGGNEYTYYYSENAAIKAIKRSDTAPAGDAVTQEIQQSGAKILAWFDSSTGTIYWYSEADTVFANADMTYALSYFTELTDISGVRQWDMSKSNILHGIFYGCSSLTDLSNLSQWDTSKVTDMAYVFSYCSNLTDVKALSEWQTGAVTDMSWMFGDCSGLTDLSGISGWDTSAVENFARTFSDCSGLTDLEALSKWDTGSVTSFVGTFASCSELTDLSGISGWDTSKVTSFANMFQYCSSLTDLEALSEWQTGAMTDMSNMFSYCSNLTSLKGLSSWRSRNYVNVDYAFSNCSSLTNLGGLENLFAGGWLKSLQDTFRNCSGLINIDALKSWRVDSVTKLQDTFDGCTNLTDISGISGWKTNDLQDMSGMFQNCSNLANVDALQDWYVRNVTDIEHMFGACTSLTDATCLNGWVFNKTPSGNKATENESWHAFYNSGITDPSKYPTWYYAYSAVSPSALTLDGNGGTVFGEPVITITPETESEADTEPESLSAEYGIDPVMLDDEMVLPDIVLLDDAAYGEPEEDEMVASPSVATPFVASASDALRDNILVLPEAERDGFTFLGWSDEEDGEVVYEAGDEIVIDGEMVLYAVWAEEPAVATPSNASRSDEPGDAGAASDPDVTEATPSEASRAKEAEEEIPSSRPDPESDPEPAPIEAATPSEPKRETDASESDPADGEPIEPNNTNE